MNKQPWTLQIIRNHQRGAETSYTLSGFLSIRQARMVVRCIMPRPNHGDGSGACLSR